MKQLITVIFFLLIFSNGYSVDQVIEGNNFFAVGKYGTARSLYRKALKKEGKPWQRAFIEYNIATTYLAERKWNQAIELYDRILESKDISPSLLPKIKVNTAVALLGQADTRLDVDDVLSISPAKLGNPVILVQAAKKIIKEAEVDFCNLYYSEGYKTCPEIYIVNDIIEALKHETAKIGKFEVAYRLTTIPFKEGSDILEKHLSSALKQLNFWQQLGREKTSDEVIASAYRNADPLWKALKSRLNTLPPLLRQLFLRSRKSFRHGLKSIALGQISGGLEQLNSAHTDLKEFLSLLPEPHPLRQKLEESISQFSDQLVFGKLTEQSLNQLEKSVNEASKYAKVTAIVENEVSESSQYMHQAISEFKLKRYLNARIYVIAAAQALQHALLNFDHLPGKDPIAYLRKTVEFQQDALDLAIEVQGAASSSEKIVEVIKKSQMNAIHSAKQFSETVFEKQQTTYENPYTYGSCIKNPWSYALPFFHQGLQRANDVIQILQNSQSPQISLVISYQKRTLKQWKAALNALEEEESDSASENQELEEEVDEENEVDVTKQEINQILQSIIEMEQQDRIPSTNLIDKIKGKVEKPW